MLKQPSQLARETERKAIVISDVRARLDQCLYAVAFVLSQRQMRERWGLQLR